MPKYKNERESMRKILSIMVSAALASSCAKHPDSIEARYVSPMIYQSWECKNILDEQGRIRSELNRISSLQQENANTDTAMMTVGVIIFWPALFALAATKDRKEELGKLKGESDALDAVIKQKQCAPGN